MSEDDLGSHAQHVDELRARIAETGITDRNLRLGALGRASGGPAIPEPYGELVDQVGGDSSRVTDHLVERVLEAAGSEKATFEVILTAAIGAGLRRWDAAQQAIQEAGDAPTRN